MSRIQSYICFLFLLCFATLIGCGETKDTKPSSSFAETVETVQRVSEERETEVADIGDDVALSGGVFRYGTGNLILPDPALATGRSQEPLYAEIYSGLTKLTDDPNDPVVGDLAEYYTLVDDESYQFVLRQSLRFSDDSPLTASDFKWSWERALKPSTGSSRALEVLGSISGAPEVLSGDSEELSGVEVVDDRTLKIRLSQPSAVFPFLLADPVASALKRGNVENWGIDWSKFNQPTGGLRGAMKFDELPVGSGPFKLVAFDLDASKVVMARNEHYHGRLAYLDGVEFVTDLFVKQDGKMVADFTRVFEEEKIDLIYVGDSSRTENERGGKILGTASGKQSSFLIFNDALQPYDEEHFRRALVMTVDVENRYAGRGYEPARSLIPPLLIGHDPDIAGLHYHPTNANTEISRSRYADRLDGITLRFQTDVQGSFRDDFEFVTEEWREKLGIDAAYDYVRSDRYEEMLSAGDIEMFYANVDARYPDGYEMLSRLVNTFGIDNESELQSEIDTAILAAVSEPDAAKRVGMYFEIQKRALESGLVMPLRWRD